MKTLPLKVGVVGSGFAAQTSHIPSILKSKDTKLVAVCDRNADLAKNVAKKFRLNKYYDDFAEMLKEERPDIVDVCTSAQAHASLSIQAMEAGCHVLVEKPLALSVNEADEMISASKRNNVKLGTVHNVLFGMAAIKLKTLVRKGVMGRLVGVEIKQTAPKNYPPFQDKDHWYHKLPGGLLFEFLPHPIYLARELLGDMEPVAVHAKKICHRDYIAADEVRMILEGENGLGTIIFSCNSPRHSHSVDIFGTEANLHADLHNSVVIKYGKYGGAESSLLSCGLENLLRGFQILVGTASTTAKVILGKRGGHRVVINEFIKSIQNDTEPPVTAEDGRKVLEILEKVVSQLDR